MGLCIMILWLCTQWIELIDTFIINAINLKPVQSRVTYEFVFKNKQL